MPGKAKKVAILNSDPEILIGVRGVILLCGYSVSCATTDCREIDRLLERQSVELLILDLPAHRPEFFTALVCWSEKYPAIPKIVYGCECDEEDMNRVLLLGVKFCIWRNEPLESFIGLVRAQLATRTVAMPLQFTTSSTGLKCEKDFFRVPMGCRELEIFELLGQGFSRKEIAEKLFISPRTVDTYLTRLKNSFGISNCRELVRLAMQAKTLPQSSDSDLLTGQFPARQKN